MILSSFRRGGFSWPHKRAMMPPAAAEMGEDEGDDDDDDEETDNEGMAASECEVEMKFGGPDQQD